MDTFYDKETEVQVLQIHDAFWKALGDRDIEKRFLNCADSITFIGSGLNEKAANKEEYIAINKKGIEQYPEKFDIKPLWKRVSLFGDLALVETEFDWEMVDEVDKGNIGEVKLIANDLVQNLEKINHHGKRAYAIVKGMLQHSRTSSGQKELTDINTLCDEYLRLAYHGLRAKDKSFNAELKTDFDLSLPKINMIPQDVGRVILNLITNAFYAVNERQKAERLKQNAESYKPTVTVSTSHSPLTWRGAGGEVIIKVADNGNGIPLKIIDKIFQPFFTTKPTGQGTGLGLSLSYDIIKAHGGEIKVETKESEGTTFIIRLFLS